MVGCPGTVSAESFHRVFVDFLQFPAIITQVKNNEKHYYSICCMNFRDDYIVFPLHRGWDDMETRVMTGPGSGNDRCHHQETISRTMTEIRTADHFPDALLPRQEYPTGERGRRRIDGRGGWVEVTGGKHDWSEKQPNPPKGRRRSSSCTDWVFRGAGGRD